MRSQKRVFLALAAASTLSACQGAGQAAKGLAANSVQNVGCKTSQSELWTSLQRIAEEGRDYPSVNEVRLALEQAGLDRGLQGAAFARYVDAFTANYNVIVAGIREKFGPNNIKMWRQALAEMEVGIRITPTHAEMDDAIASSMKVLAAAETQLDATCSQPPNDGRTPAGEMDPQINVEKSFSNVWEQLKAGAPEIYGARRVLATIYQSCDVLALAPLSAATPAVQGITQDAKRNSQNGGILRHYGSLASIDATHYYIHGQRLASGACQEIRNHPPIYDFGGKPFTSTSNASLLDLMRGDGGTGSEVYGIDCSGFIFSSLAAAGLRIIDPDPNKPLKATMILGTPAAAFKEPQSNHLGCLQKLTMTKSQNLQPGDIVATTGHVIMIDTVGADPFGLKSAGDVAACENLSYKNFDFTVTQSSPSKGAIGINRYVAKDYLAGSTTMRVGLTAYAKALCRTHFGAPAALSSPDMSIVRHKKTPECHLPEFKLGGQECVASCPAL